MALNATVCFIKFHQFCDEPDTFLALQSIQGHKHKSSWSSSCVDHYDAV